MTYKILEKVDRDEELMPAEMKALLEVTNPAELQALYDCAYRVKAKYVGKVAYFRGIIECSNICIKDCYYCGIRKSNTNVKRFQMDEEEMVREANWAFENEYGSVVIQSGERQDAAYIELIERVLRRIKAATDGKLGVTLSLGEQTEETYRRWREAGAHRYLLRIETTNPELYKKLHPADHDFAVRKNCLALLKKTGYQVGTGVMMGLPGQTMNDLVADILFMKELDVDMVGMGPYIPHHETPMGKEIPPYTDEQKQAALTLGLKMIAVTRIVLKDVNIASTTALQARWATLAGACARKRCCKAVSSASAMACSTKPSSSPLGTSSPLWPVSTSSSAAALAYDSNARPLASASGTTLPKVSVRLGNKNKSADA